MTQILSKLSFNTEPMYYMHIDLNSCFATIEQQANPLLRYKPLGVAAYNSPKGVILAASVEAKKLGIKTGTRVFEAKQLCPDIIIVEPDADKYRYIHHRLNALLKNYTHEVHPKSIDEFVLNFKNTPGFKKGLLAVGAEIKAKIKSDIGDYITVSVGIAQNKFLAKTASNLKKPDGLEYIDQSNALAIYSKLELLDLCGIGYKNNARLGSRGIHTVADFYRADPVDLKNVFSSVEGYFWYLKLRGYEIENYPLVRRSFSHQYALPKPMSTLQELHPIFTKLVEKLGFRLRTSGFKTMGVNLYLRYTDHTSWHTGRKTKKVLFASRDIYKELALLFTKAPKKPISLINVGCFNLVRSHNMQLDLFDDIVSKEKLAVALDSINHKWGKFVISSAGIVSDKKYVPDRIGFGNVG